MSRVDEQTTVAPVLDILMLHGYQPPEKLLHYPA